MLKILSLTTWISLLHLLCFNSKVNAQQTIRCATMQTDSMLRDLHPELGTLDEFEKSLQTAINFAKSNPNARIVNGVYEIPVVVHVIHNGEAIGTGTNISDLQIQSQIDVLNEDFRKISGTPGFNTHPAGADTKIQFCLAKRAPNGSATTGINRINRSTAGFSAPPYPTAYINANIKPYTFAQGWIPTNYLNLWSCNITGGILGYAQFPTNSGLKGMTCSGGASNTDGVVFLYSSIGRPPYNTSPGPYNLGRTCTHEVGHWLGLRHIWGDAACGVDDFCGDTPDAPAANFGCPTGSNTCVDVPVDAPDMIENYMDYTDDNCMNIFTYDQMLRMRTVLETSRLSLITSTTCIPPAASDAAVVDVKSPLNEICTTTFAPIVTVKNFGTAPLTSATINYQLDGGTPLTYAWTGSVGSNASLNITLPNITTAVGNHSFNAWTTLPNGVTDPNNANDNTLSNFAVTNGTQVPYLQDFESNQFPPSNWSINQPSIDCFTWNTQPGITGSSGTLTTTAYNYHFMVGTTNNMDELISPAFDLTTANAATVKMEFDVAYARRSATAYEDLSIFISNDCGSTWSATPIYAKNGNGTLGSDLRTTNPTANVATDWSPTAAQWRKETISLTPYIGNNIKFKFVTTNRGGNNIYLDNIKISDRPVVSYTLTSMGTSEGSVTGTVGCRSYRSLTIALSISEASATPVVVSFTGAGVAQSISDYTISTPTVTFPAGSTANQNATILIWDDPEVESLETFTMSFTTTSNALASPTAKDVVVSITDNDTYLVPSTSTIFSENFETSGGNLPVGWLNSNITVGTNKWVVGPGATGGLTGAGNYSAYITNNVTTKVLAYTNNSTTSTVIVTPSINTTGLSNIKLTFNWRCTGEKAGATFWDYGHIMYSTTSQNGGYQNVAGTELQGQTATQTKVVTFPVAASNVANLYIVFIWDNDNSAGANPPIVIDNISVTGDALIEPSVESVLNANTDKYLGPNTTINFYNNATSKIMLSITNTSSHDYGCTNVTIDRAGAGASAYTVSNTTNFMCDKTFLVTPTTNNILGTYDIKLYYTQAEINGWMTATGQSFAIMNLAKTGGAISNITPTTPSANGATNFIGTAPTRGNIGVADKFIGASFSSGFSGFAAGNPVNSPLSIDLLSFDGEAQNDVNILHWITLTEMNTDYFIVQRSNNGYEFDDLTMMAASGNSKSEKKYNFTDTHILKGYNYYRIKIVEKDGLVNYTNVIALENKMHHEGIVKLYPNPTSLEINLDYYLNNDAKLTFTVLDLSGRVILIENKQAAKGMGSLTLETQSLSSGFYIFQMENKSTQEFSREKFRKL